MPDWSELPHDLLVLIGRHINLIEDYLHFSTVCKSWRSVATKDNFNSDLPRVPWLMLAEEEDDNIDKDSSCRKFVSLYNGMILKKRIPKASGKRCMESMGWLITVGKDEGEISLLHPFSGVQIDLPHPNTTEGYQMNKTDDFYPWTFVQKAVLSASPSHTSDYVLMIIEGEFGFLSFWRPRDLLWTRIGEVPTVPHFRDVVHFNGYFFAVDKFGHVRVCDVAGHEPTSHIVASTEPPKGHIVEQLWPPPDRGKFYILESLGSLFVAVQHGVQFRYTKDDCDRIPLTPTPSEYDDDKEYTYGTTRFQVFLVDLSFGKMRQIMDLGDRAFFLGANASLSVQTSHFPGIKPNHIYFTDNCLYAYLDYEEGGGLDMGVFNLADGSIQPHYDGVSLSCICPPTWVTPTLC